MADDLEHFTAAHAAAREAWSHALRGGKGDTNAALAYQADAFMKLVDGLVAQLSTMSAKVDEIHAEMERRARR